jgi:hypothetical protein
VPVNSDVHRSLQNCGSLVWNLSVSQTSGTWNLEVACGFLESIWTCGLIFGTLVSAFLPQNDFLKAFSYF